MNGSTLVYQVIKQLLIETASQNFCYFFVWECCGNSAVVQDSNSSILFSGLLNLHFLQGLWTQNSALNTVLKGWSWDWWHIDSEYYLSTYPGHLFGVDKGDSAHTLKMPAWPCPPIPQERGGGGGGWYMVFNGTQITMARHGFALLFSSAKQTSMHT